MAPKQGLDSEGKAANRNMMRHTEKWASFMSAAENPAEARHSGRAY